MRSSRSSSAAPAAVLLELAGVRVGRPVVGDGGGHQQHVGALEASAQAAASSAAVSTSTSVTPGGARQRDVGGDDRDLGAAARGLVGEREAHPAGRAVADVAHGVDRLARPAGGDEHAEAVEVAGVARRAATASTAASSSGGSGRRPIAALAERAERAGAGLEHARAARAQRARLACVAGCSYMALFIAGATISGRGTRARRR